MKNTIAGIGAILVITLACVGIIIDNGHFDNAVDIYNGLLTYNTWSAETIDNKHFATVQHIKSLFGINNKSKIHEIFE